MSSKLPCLELDKLSPSEVRSFVDSFDTVMTDCDGVLWLGNDAIPGAAEAIHMFRDMGKRVFFVTNNSTKSREDYVQKCNKLGFGGNLNEIIGSSYLVASYLNSIEFKGKVYVIGMEGITKELDNFGIRHEILDCDPYLSNLTLDKTHALISQTDPELNGVVLGFDNNINYLKIAKASTILHRPGSIFVATNPDQQTPFKNHCLLPSTGTFIAALSTASGRKPVIMGKPSPNMFEEVRKAYPDIDPARTLMIGDRGNTDVLLGKNCGLQTLMVGSGVHKFTDIRHWAVSDHPEQRRMVPDYFVNRLGDIKELIDDEEVIEGDCTAFDNESE